MRLNGESASSIGKIMDRYHSFIKFSNQERRRKYGNYKKKPFWISQK